jgi:hypothetical protein
MARKLILILMVIVVSVFAQASPDEKSDLRLRELQQKVAGWGDYRVEFTVEIDGQALSGAYEVSGESYHLTTPDIELYCDGATKYEVNKLDREVMIDRVDPADRTVMGNPARLFDFMDGSYTHRYIGPALIDGVGCERLELTEIATIATGAGTTQTPVGQTIDLFLSRSTGLPVRVGYTIGFMSTQAVIDIVSITPGVILGGAFRYEAARYNGYEVIDFR